MGVRGGDLVGRGGGGKDGQVAADPGETTNIAASHPGLVTELEAIWIRDWQ